MKESRCLPIGSETKLKKDLERRAAIVALLARQGRNALRVRRYVPGCEEQATRFVARCQAVFLTRRRLWSAWMS